MWALPSLCNVRVASTTALPRPRLRMAQRALLVFGGLALHALDRRLRAAQLLAQRRQLRLRRVALFIAHPSSATFCCAVPIAHQR